MKTTFKKSLGLLLTILLIASYAPLQAQEETPNENYVTVSGVIKDKQSKKKLEYVNISIPGTTIGTVTNEDGEFALKVKESLHGHKT